MKRLLPFLVLLISGNLLAQQTVGLFSKLPEAEDGYVLLAPTASTETYLIDKCGKEVHKWTSAYTPGFSAYMLDDGTMLRTGFMGNRIFSMAGSGGMIQRLNWSGNPIWNLKVSSNRECQHHDICYLPNGNVLAIVWELKTDAEAIAAGRDSAIMGPDMWPDKIVEYQPIGANSANVVWEWHAWDHLVQDHDSTKMNYGVIADNPGKLNINHISGSAFNPDWLHVNSVAYNAQLDQIMLSSFFFNEIWIIDHSTTTQEARGTSGGRSGRGGEILYRWGNPQIYGRGTPSDQRFFESHDAHWIPQGYPDEGKIMVFNNGNGRLDGNYSTVEIISPEMDEKGNYILKPRKPYGPDNPDWIYQAAPNKYDFFSAVMAGAERLPNGNTLICEATKGNLFEVDTNGKTVWQYVNPVGLTGIIKQGDRIDQNMVFRVRQYPPNYKGFSGKSLVPGKPIEINPLPYICGAATPNGIALEQGATPSIRVVNPFSEQLVITAQQPLSKAQLSLSNMLGMNCGQWTLHLQAGQAQRIKLNDNLPSGLYQLQIQQGSSIETYKLLRE